MKELKLDEHVTLTVVKVTGVGQEQLYSMELRIDGKKVVPHALYDHEPAIIETAFDRINARLSLDTPLTTVLRDELPLRWRESAEGCLKASGLPPTALGDIARAEMLVATGAVRGGEQVAVHLARAAVFAQCAQELSQAPDDAAEG